MKESKRNVARRAAKAAKAARMTGGQRWKSKYARKNRSAEISQGFSRRSGSPPFYLSPESRAALKDASPEVRSPANARKAN